MGGVEMAVVVGGGGSGGGEDDGSNEAQNSRYNFYTTISKQPGRLGDYRVLTNARWAVRPNPPLLPMQISSTLTLFRIDIRLMSC